MKIIIVTRFYPPKYIGGTEIASMSIAMSLVKKKHEVHVITSSDPDNPSISKESGVVIHRMSLPKIRYLDIIFFWWKAQIHIAKIGASILLIQSIPMGLTGFIAKRSLHIPYIIWGQGSDVYCNWLFKKPLSHLIIKKAEKFLALTAHMAQHARNLGANNISVVPNGINLDNYFYLSKNKARKRYKINENDNVILFVGGLKKIKGVKYLIFSMRIIIESFPQTKLVIAGKGPEKEKLEKLIQRLGLINNICFIGSISHNRIPEVMAMADIFVLPSYSEGFPLVVLEAMASGLPIVATKVGGIPEIITDMRTGLLVNTKDSESMACKISLLLSDINLRKSISENSKKEAANYDWNKIVERLESILYQVISK